MKNQNKSRVSPVVVLFSLVCLAFLTNACEPVEPVDEFETLRDHLDMVLDDMAPTKGATDVKMIVDDPTESAKYEIVSVRSNEHYLTGHVPGAINIPWRTIADDDSLAMLDMTMPAIVYCYTGHTGQVAQTVLSALGYESYNMKFGMMGWTDDPDVLNTTPFDCAPPNYDVETMSNDLPADNALPVIDTGETEAEDIAKMQAQTYLSGGMAPVKAATDVKMIIDDPMESAEYTIVSVRSNEHYLTGHVPGAINIPWRTIAEEDNLKMIPADKPVIVYCYTGHTGQVAATVLNILGYEAYNMKFGMMGWTDDPDVLNTTPFDCAPPNYDVETGP